MEVREKERKRGREGGWREQREKEREGGRGEGVSVLVKSITRLLKI